MTRASTGSIRLVSDGTTDANRATFSGVLTSTAKYNGVNPYTGVAAASSLQDGRGVWCDTCGNGSFLTGNMTRGNVQAGADIEFAGTVGTQKMTYNTGVGNFYGLLLTRRSHNVTVANNTEVSNFITATSWVSTVEVKQRSAWSATRSRTTSARRRCQASMVPL